MTDNFKVQWSTKIGGDMINFRGESVEEVASQIDSMALLVGDMLENLKAIAEAGKDLVAAQAAANSLGGQGGGAAQAAPASAGASASSPAGGTGDHSCPHGQRQYKSGHGARGKWEAYFCPLPKGTPGGCAPEWV